MNGTSRSRQKSVLILIAEWVKAGEAEDPDESQSGENVSHLRGLMTAAAFSAAFSVAVMAAFSPNLAAESKSVAPAVKAKPFKQEGIASFYSHRGRNASGGRSDPNTLTAAHKYLPLGSRALVTHLKSGKTVIVTINDRGPFRKGRIIDLSRMAAKQLGITGVARVSVVSAD